MRLALILFRYFPFGGLQRDFLRIATKLHEQGYQLTVYTMEWQGERPAFLTIHEIPVTAWTNHGRCCQFANEMQPLLSQQNYAAVIGFNKIPGLTIYFAADDCFKAKAIEEKSWWYRLTSRYRNLQRLEASVFSPGKNTDILLLNQRQAWQFIYYYNTEPNRLTLLPPSIGMVEQSSESIPNVNTSDIILLMVASHFHTKGVDRSLHALASLQRHDVKLLIAGDDKPARYTSLIKKLHLENQVQFLGPRHDVPALMKKADILIHPARQEAAGYVLLEAVVAGLPVITTAICGYAEYINKAQAGVVLTHPFQQSNLNQTLAKLMNKSVRENFHQQALEYASHLDLQQMVPVAIETINRIIKDKHNREDPLDPGQMLRIFPEPLCRELPVPGKCAAFVRDPGDLQFWLATDELLPHLPEGDPFEILLHYQGTIHRALENRKTIEVYIGGKHYFIKQHYGVGWREIIKNILQARLPIIGATNEWRALQLLPTLSINTMPIIAYGCKGKNPAAQQSFIVTGALEDTISLEQLCATWPKNPPAYPCRLAMIKEVARMSRALHGAYIYHRDFYICHFLLHIPQGVDYINSKQLTIYLIDLHRALIKKSVSNRWLIKDLAGLYFSSMDCGITPKDIYRFLRIYYQQPLRTIFSKKRHILKAVTKRARLLYSKHNP